MPFKPLTFIGNRAMVQFIREIQVGHEDPKDHDSLELLRQIGFFAPDKRLLPRMNNDKPFKPTIGVLLLTTACNMNCVYCYASAGPGHGQTMPVETGKWLIDTVHQNAKQQNKDRFSICLHGGGEPTVARKVMTDLVRHAHSKDLSCRISLTTNGYFSATDAEKLLNGVSEVSFSFDGMADVQNRQRPPANGKGSFDRVFHTLKLIEEKNIPYGIRMSVMDGSIDALPENIDFLCRNTNCRTFQVEPVFKSGRARLKGNWLKENARFIQAFMGAMETAFKHGRHMYYSGVRPWLVTNSFCMAPREALIINHNSELTTCYEVYDRDHELGDFFFYGALNSRQEPHMDFSKRERLLDKIKARQMDCIAKNCFCFPYCAGDCPPKAFLAQEDEKTGDSPRCELNRALSKEMMLFYIEKAGGIWRGEKIRNDKQ